VKRGRTYTEEPPERTDDVPERRELIRRTGVQGLTLLKNDGVLPIGPDKKIAMIGPNAKRAVVHGGGSASLKPYYTVNPFDGLQAELSTPLLYARGCETNKWLPLISDANLTTPDGVPGVIVEFYRGDLFKGNPAYIHHKAQTDLFLWDSAPMDVLPAYSFKVRAKLTPATSGNHTFGFMSVGPGRLLINGELFIDNWDWTEEGEAMFDGSVDVLKTIYLEEGVTVDLLVESTNEVRPVAKKSFGGRTHQYGGCRIGYQEETKSDLIQEAVDVAREADVAIVCVGLDDEWESEGYDRQSMDLPLNGSQDRLVAAVVKANPNTIVVNQSGSPVTMPWADDVAAIVQAWYQGQEAGNALADVLLGRANPSGKLPTTFPKRLADNPSYHNWPGENENVIYGEGMYMGYRHYDRTGIAPLFAFGHGLSYTTFEYGEPTISNTVLGDAPPLNTVTVSLPVTNTGAVAGSEIVQAYIHDPKSRIPRPEKELKAFARTDLAPGETKWVHLTLDKYSVGYYDTTLSSWIAEEGAFEVLLASSSVDIRYALLLISLLFGSGLDS
jgi:beta-glucosidase